jgi:hypothetical protein
MATGLGTRVSLPPAGDNCASTSGDVLRKVRLKAEGVGLKALGRWWRGGGMN